MEFSPKEQATKLSKPFIQTIHEWSPLPNITHSHYEQKSLIVTMSKNH